VFGLFPPFVTPINGISPAKGDKCVHELAFYQKAISNLLKWGYRGIFKKEGGLRLKSSTLYVNSDVAADSTVREITVTQCRTGEPLYYNNSQHFKDFPQRAGRMLEVLSNTNMAKTVDSMTKYIYISAYLEGNGPVVIG
jgi:hypothetical protein